MNHLECPSTSPLMPITPRPDAVMIRGAGSYLWDDKERRYLDFIQGWAVNALGHCAPEVQEALARQAATLIAPSPALHNRPQLELAARLTQLSGLSGVHFANSGAEANEVAIKLARKWGAMHRNGAYEIISCERAFHGRTLATMALSGKPGWDKLFPPNPTGFLKVPFGDADAVAQSITAKTVAIMVEPIQGEGGVNVPPDDYLTRLRQLADAHNLLLILDEIQTGVGRTGTFFAYERANESGGWLPDIVTLGKGLGGGVPLSAVLARAHANCFVYGDQGGTYNGNPLVTAVGHAVVDVVSDARFLAQVRNRGAQLAAILCEAARQWGEAVSGVRGAGLLWALELAEPAAADICARAFAHGLLVNPAQPDVLRFMPSLRVSVAELAEFETLLCAALAAPG